MSKDLIEASSKVPTEERALRQLHRHIDLGQLEELPEGEFPTTPRYLVTFMKSETIDRVRTATVVTVTNQSKRPIRVSVSYFKGFTDNTSPVGVTTFSIPPDFTVDFASRTLPGSLTVVNSVPSPELTADEGRAIVSATEPEIGVSARVYYTEGDRDEQVLAITDAKVVVFGAGNNGD
jgi:hypothetical protein